ncbi:DNA adenine methylase [Thiomicrorhabdus lithotrophica]|uniref:DNA adenine methylase n=1 Tax=Thiomicrorhabdus lithotrophica TaxID=2949997 RepID=A0ABY8CAD5_9GAMM|nr:DNA adenine methylase [Thiomicrorhabdus lithotrophica]WEJ62192.1 DNA adenine methylase [Thiomicrorhabdus lithotrophica]
MQPIKSPVLRYHGGKFRIADWIQSFFPPHTIYVEPFGGAASVLMTKKPSDREVYNDLDSEIVNVFEVLRNNPSELARLINLTPYARDEWKQSYEKTDNKIELARRTILRAYASFGSGGATKGTSGFRCYSKPDSTFSPKEWNNYANKIEAFTDRLRSVIIENKNAINVIKDHDHEKTLFFIDPPYITETRTMTPGTKYYRHEMDNEAHQELINTLLELKGAVVLSGYDHHIYDVLIDNGWEKHHKKSRAQGHKGTTSRVETVWLNPKCANHQSQQQLFS